jgi:hypothetical protein
MRDQWPYQLPAVESDACRDACRMPISTAAAERQRCGLRVIRPTVVKTGIGRHEAGHPVGATTGT